MILYDLLEDAIVDRLAPLVTDGIEVEPLPDTPAKYDAPFKYSRITVAYRSSEFSKEVVRGLPNMFATDRAVQEEYASVEIIYRARKLRGVRGVHDLTQRIDELLLGFMPPNWGRMFLSAHTFVEHEVKEGIWVYASTFVTRCIRVEKQEEEVLVNLNQVTINDNVE